MSRTTIIAQKRGASKPISTARRSEILRIFVESSCITVDDQARLINVRRVAPNLIQGNMISGRPQVIDPAIQACIAKSVTEAELVELQILIRTAQLKNVRTVPVILLLRLLDRVTSGQKNRQERPYFTPGSTPSRARR